MTATRAKSRGASSRKGSTSPREGRCGARLRGRDAGRFCANAPEPGRNRCRDHGGLSPRAAASPHFRHGLRSNSSADVDREIYTPPPSTGEQQLLDRDRRDPESALRHQLAEGRMHQRRAWRAGNLELYVRLGQMNATTARALVILREVPPPERALPTVVEMLEGKTIADFEHDLEVVRRDAEIGRVAS